MESLGITRELNPKQSLRSLITQRANPLGHHVQKLYKSIGRPEFRLYEPQAKSQASTDGES